MINQQGSIFQPHWRDFAILLLKENTMGKYLIGWILGVPAIVLLLVYFFFH
ncbi:MAG: hypothetical protein JWQ21_2158 [Herminiimonas sp.]|jgi:hypothetical protein|nr:hypothetical protein [Herminiimonas sp.]